MRKLIFAVALALSTLPASAQEPEIVVTGERLREALNAFVEEVSVPVSADNQLGRWQGALCPGVAGLRAEQAQTLIDRIALRAHQLGVETGESGCRANLTIFVSPDASAFTRRLFEEDRSLFAYFYEQNISTRGHEALAAFLDATAPVRWWHVMRRTTHQGMHLASTNTRQAPRGGFRDVSIVPSEGTRLRQSIRQEFLRVIVVIDARQTQDIPLAAVADYVAMTSLAQIDPSADTSAQSTILNLFRSDAAARPTEMTAWDIAYLRGLYNVTPEAAAVSQQRAEMVWRMERDLARPRGD